MTDSEITNLVAHALQQEGSAGLPALTALRDRVQAERGPLGPALGPVWDALVEVTSRRHEDLDALLQLSEQRARWLASVRGPADPATIRAWVELGFAAEDEYLEPLATRAWEAVAAAPIDIDALPADVLPLVSQALRGLAGSRRGAGALDEARRLFERDLALNEKIAPAGSPQLALSLQNLAALLERHGERTQALALRRRQRGTLVAIAASRDLLASVDEAIARLAAP